MSFEDAADEIEDAMALLKIAYKKLMSVQKSCPKPEGYPLKDVIITLGTAELTLVIVREEYLNGTEIAEIKD